MASPHLVPAATVTTGAKPHGQQQLARDLEVERAVVGQRCRPQSFGEVQRCYPLFSFHILSTPVVGHPLPISLSGNLRNGLGIDTTTKKFFIFVPVQVVFENTATAYSAPNRTGQTGQAPLFVQ